MESEPTDGIKRENINRLLDTASLGLAIHGIKTILNPDTFPLINEEFHKRAIAEAESLGWFQDGVLNAPPEIMALIFRNNNL